MDNIFDYHASSEYVFKTSEFEGPIDLLISLVKANGLDIHTFKIADITDQYLQMVDSMDKTNLDGATDFLVMAATLLEMKALAMLPGDEVIVDDDEEYLNPEDEIKRLMIEHELFKEKAEIIKKSETLNRFYREPSYDEKDARLSIKGFNLDKLMQAYAKVLFEFSKEDEAINIKQIERKPFTVAEQMDKLISELITRREVSFFDIFDEAVSVGEIINTFLALLQLVNRQFAKIMQVELLSDIIIGVSDNCDVNTFDYNTLASANKEDGFDEKFD